MSYENQNRHADQTTAREVLNRNERISQDIYQDFSSLQAIKNASATDDPTQNMKAMGFPQVELYDSREKQLHQDQAVALLNGAEKSMAVSLLDGRQHAGRGSHGHKAEQAESTSENKDDQLNEGQARKSLGELHKYFNEIDTNNDGLVTDAELGSFMGGRGSEMMRKAQGDSGKKEVADAYWAQGMSKHEMMMEDHKSHQAV